MAKPVSGKWMGWVLALGLCAPACQRPLTVQRQEVARDRGQQALDWIAEMRGLRPREPIPVEILSEIEFRRHEVATDLAECRSRQRVGEESACKPKSEKPAKEGELFSGGEYNKLERRVILRDLADTVRSMGFNLPQDEYEESMAMFLGHELYHGLQHQYFGLPESREFPDRDAAAAAEAAIEGDATLMGLIVGARAMGFSWEYRLQNIRSQMQREPHLAGSYLLGFTPWERGPESVGRARAFGEYVNGLRLAVQLYFLGGFKRVDELYRKLPTSTEQVLHLDKYLAGEKAIPIAESTWPDGTDVLYSDVLGEADTRALLSVCLNWQQACTAATGWGGDRLEVARRAAGTLAFVWLSVWDDEAAAERFLSAVQSSAACVGQSLWRLRESDEVSEPKAGGAPGFVQRQGRGVGIAHGLAEGEAAALAAPFFASLSLAKEPR